MEDRAASSSSAARQRVINTHSCCANSSASVSGSSNHRRSECRQGGADGMETRVEDDRAQLIPLLWRKFLHRSDVLQTGIVHQNIHATKLRLGRRHERRDLSGPTEVGRDGRKRGPRPTPQGPRADARSRRRRRIHSSSRWRPPRRRRVPGTAAGVTGAELVFMEASRGIRWTLGAS